DGSAPLTIACPATGPACEGSVGLAMSGGEPGLGHASSLKATAASARGDASLRGGALPRGAITLARTDFSAAPGETVTGRLSLPMATRNQVERLGKIAVFPTIDLGSGPVRGGDLTLTPDPRTARLLDAGKDLALDHGRVTLHLACARNCSGRISLAGHTKTF